MTTKKGVKAMKLKRFSVICISILLSLSSSLLAFADVDDNRVNGTGGGNIAQDSNEAYAARYNVYTENQGMRIYLVDKRGKTVSSFVDIVQYRPETIEQGLITQSNSGSETTAYYTQLYKTYKDFTGYLPRTKEYLYLSGTKFDSQGGKFNQNLQGSSLKGGKMYTYAQISAYMDAWYQAEYNTQSPINSNTQLALPILRDMSDYTLKGQGDLVREQLDIEVADKSLDMNMLGYLLNMKLPTWDENGKLISSEMESLITYKNTADKNLAGSENDIVKVAQERGYYVAMEPLHWAVLEIRWPTCFKEEYRGIDLNAFACSTRVVYGTESTVYNYFYTDALNAGWKDQGYNMTEMFPNWCWGLGKYAFQLKEGDAELGLSTIPQSWDKITNQVDLQTLAESSRSVGYGLMLMKTSPSSKTEKTADILKVFRENGEVTDIKQETTDKKVYTIPNEEGYKYTENKKSDDDPLQNIETWEQVTGSTSTENTVTVEESTKTIYILYDKTDIATKQLVLHENELSYTYSLKDLVKNGSLASIYDSVKSATQAGASRPSCGGHDCGDEGCSGNHKCNSDDKSLSDNSFLVSVKNDFDYNNTAFIKDFVADESTLRAQGLATWAGGAGESYKAEPNADFLLYRNKEKDLVTLYPSKNDALLSDLGNLGISNISYKPSATRIAKESISKYFTDNFVTDWVYAEDRDTGLAWNWERYGSYGSHTENGDYDTETATGHSPQDANALYSQAGNIKENYYLGKANTATDAPQPWYDLGLENYSQNKANSIASADLKFYPYVKMLYHAKGDNSTAQEVAVTSENLSTMKVYNTAVIGVKKNTLPNVNLDSTQWSTHARSLKFLQNKQVKDKKSVLAGGAILNLDTLQAGNTELGIRLYLSCLPDSQVSAVADGSFNTSETQARQLAEAYKNEVQQVLSGYGLVQYAKAGFTTERKDLLKQGKLLEANKKVELGNRLFTTNKDDKYYLRQNGTGAGRANLDILNLSEAIHIYTVKADWDGQLWVEKDGLAITEKTQDLNALLANTEVDVLNKNTKLISNFYNSLDRAGGKDRENKAWYNEAFDGVSVLVSDLRYSLGFKVDMQRSTVLDPSLQGVAQSKSDLYNFDDTMLNNTLRTSCFFTTAKSTAEQAQGKNGGYIGTVAGNSTMQALNTSLSDIQYLMFSKIFYITNANVSDLN